MYVLINLCLKVGQLSVYYSNGPLSNLIDLKKNRHQKIFSLGIQAVMSTCLRSQLFKAGGGWLAICESCVVWEVYYVIVYSIFFQTKSVH